MSQSSLGNGGPDFDLPDEVLSVIPTDPYAQLDLARKITSMAIAARVSKLESDVGRMKQKLYEKDRAVFELEEKAARLERTHQEAETRLKLALDENMRLSKERDSLSMTVKKLSHDLVKLEKFKRQLVQSLNDDNSTHIETVDIGTCDQSVPKCYPDKDDDSNGYVPQHSSRGSTESVNGDEGSRLAMQRFSLTPYITPRLTPTGTPKVISTAASPGGYSAAGSPQKTSGATSPSNSQYGGRALSSWYSSSQQSSAATSPTRARSLPSRTPRIDGREFFRQARIRLSYEQFSAFLANIKELNAQKQTREETLRKAEEIFGTENKDLYLSLEGLLNRNVH